MVRRLYAILESIFIETPTLGEVPTNIYKPEDLTKHYRQELSDMAIDGVYVATQYKYILTTLEAYKYRSERTYAV